MSSSDESSDDEEEQRRISEAVLGIGTTLYEGSKKKDTCSTKISNPPCENNGKAGKSIKPNSIKNVDVSHLKSNRPQDKNEDEEMNSILQTTPEFRSYVAKQLSKLLDRDLTESVVESVWDSSLYGRSRTERGVKLFSDSKSLCKVSNLINSSSSSMKDVDRQKKRKIRLSSSSDSSEDEDIKACVFTVADIEQENETLSRLKAKPVSETEQKQTEGRQPGAEHPAKSRLPSSSFNACDEKIAAESDGLKAKGKKKKKKKKTKEKVS